MRNALSFAALARCVRASDAGDFNLDLKAERVAIVQAAVDLVGAEPSVLATFRTGKVRQRDCVIYNDYSAVVILRALSRFISNRFRLYIPSRDHVIQSVIEALSDNTPLYVIRRDISSFYETLPIEYIRDRLLFDTAIARRVRRQLKAYFDAHCSSNTHGLPRGTGLSAVLAELAMQDYDRQARGLPGVYRYFRYSDDILIFCYRDHLEICSALDSMLPDGVSYNSEKSYVREYYNLSKKLASSEPEFEYLGYAFRATEFSGSSDPRRVTVRISGTKIARFKKRIVLSLKSYSRDKNSVLLVRRMRYLSGNYKLSRTPAFFTNESKHIYSGIYYNYKRCGTYEKGLFKDGDADELKELDRFFHALLHGKKSPFSSVIKANMSSSHRAMLRKVSFSKGYKSRIGFHVAASEINLLKSIWRNH